MASYNSRFTFRNDSSGSDDADFGYLGQVPTELHHKSDCGYRKFMVNIGGSRAYVWLRSCMCGQYVSYDIKKGVKNLDEEEGKDVHYSAECRWRKTKKGDGWQLRQKCLGCVRPRTAAPSYTGNHSQTWGGFRNYSGYT